MSNDTGNKRIAKNTAVLYTRMLLTVGISFYTTRLILQHLGVSDYGLYGIIGSVTAMMYTVTSAISQGVSRFFTFGLGKGDKTELRKVFSTSMLILLGFSLVIVLLGETIGLWYVNNRLNVDDGRLGAANWVYQFALLTFILDFICVPYDAAIVAHERMKAFAFITILKVIINFIIAIAIAYSPLDRLVSYAFLMCLCSLVMRFVYYSYCNRNFEECHMLWHFDKSIFKEIAKFSGWTFLTSIVCIIATTGSSLIVNAFYGTVVNAAQNVSSQLSNLAISFNKNFSIAYNPQITKNYAANNKERTLELLYMGSKISFLLLFIIALPLMFEVDFILGKWLKEVPPYASYYVIFGLLNSFCSAVLSKNATLNAATGDIRNFQIAMAIGFCIPLPLTYVMLSLGYPPYWSFIATIIAHIVTAYWQISLNSKHIDVSFAGFAKKVFVPLSFIAAVSASLLLVIRFSLQPSWFRAILTGMSGVSSVAILSFYFALNKSEREKVTMIITQKFRIHK